MSEKARLLRGYALRLEMLLEFGEIQTIFLGQKNYFQWDSLPMISFSLPGCPQSPTVKSGTQRLGRSLAVYKFLKLLVVAMACFRILNPPVPDTAFAAGLANIELAGISVCYQVNAFDISQRSSPGFRLLVNDYIKVGLRQIDCFESGKLPNCKRLG